MFNFKNGISERILKFKKKNISILNTLYTADHINIYQIDLQ